MDLGSILGVLLEHTVVVQYTIAQLEGVGELFKNSWTLSSNFSRMHASWSARAPKIKRASRSLAKSGFFFSSFLVSFARVGFLPPL